MKQSKKNKLIDEGNGLGRFFQLAPSDKYYVTSLILLEDKKILEDYKSDFDLNGSKPIELIEHKTKHRFRKMDVFESYIIAIDVDYDNEDVILLLGMFSN